MSEPVDFLEHVRVAVGHVGAVPKSSVQPGAGDDELHAALPQGSNAEAVRLIEAGRDDPLYAQLMTAIAVDPAILEQVRVQWETLAAEHEAFDLGTPYAEDDAEGDAFLAVAEARAQIATVLLAVLVDHEPGGAAFLATESGPEAERAANDRLLGRISEREGARLRGPARALHGYLGARRTGSPEIDSAAQALIEALEAIRLRKADDPHEWAIEAFDFILTRIERPGAYRRAELKSPAVLAYLRQAIHAPRAEGQEPLSLDQPIAGEKGDVTRGETLAAADNVAEVEARLELEDLVAAAGLTKRELDVFPLLLGGLTQVEIGERLSMAPGTVGVHSKNLKDKLRRGRAAT